MKVIQGMHAKKFPELESVELEYWFGERKEGTNEKQNTTLVM